MGDTPHMLHGGAGGDNAECELDVLASHAACDDRFERWQVVGIYDISNTLHRELRPWIELEDPVGFLRPVVIVAEQVCNEAASLAQSLRSSEDVVGSTELNTGRASAID